MSPRALEILVDGPRSGIDNMAIDRGALRACERGELSSPFLRLYQWAPAAVSLGFHQPASCLDHASLARAGLDVVRRPTGGAAVLHAQEWTYGIVAPFGVDGLGDGFRAVYASLATCFVRALRELGIPADTGGGGVPEGFVCFEAIGGHEIAVDGRKLVGSAFRKGRGAFLQHGSLLTGPTHLDLIDHLAVAGDEHDRKRRRRELAARTIHLGELGLAAMKGEALGDALGRALEARTGRVARQLTELPGCVVAAIESERDAARVSVAVAG